MSSSGSSNHGAKPVITRPNASSSVKGAVRFSARRGMLARSVPASRLVTTGATIWSIFSTHIARSFAPSAAGSAAHVQAISPATTIAIHFTLFCIFFSVSGRCRGPCTDNIPNPILLVKHEIVKLQQVLGLPWGMTRAADCGILDGMNCKTTILLAAALAVGCACAEGTNIVSFKDAAKIKSWDA